LSSSQAPMKAASNNIERVEIKVLKRIFFSYAFV
jgi:hypothetical protein